MKYAWIPFGQSGSSSVWMHAVRHRPEQVGDRLGRPRGTARTSASPSSSRPGRDGDERRDLLAVPLLRDHRQRRRGRQVDEGRDVVGRVGRPSRNSAQQVRRRARRDRRSGPRRRSGRPGAASSSNCVTIPKLPPPPRSPQSRSAFSVSLAWTSRPSAVTTSAPTRLSQARPCLRISQPMPPPSVKPPTPVDGDEAAGRGEAVRLRLVVDVGPDGAAADGRAARLGVDAHAVHRPEVDHDAVVARREAGDAVAAAAHGDRQVVAAREADRGDHVGRAGAADDQRRAGGRRASPFQTRHASA